MLAMVESSTTISCAVRMSTRARPACGTREARGACSCSNGASEEIVPSTSADSVLVISWFPWMCGWDESAAGHGGEEELVDHPGRQGGRRQGGAEGGAGAGEGRG